jgi:hypothetical protein
MTFKRGDIVAINDPELIGSIYMIQTVAKSPYCEDQFAYFTNGNFCNVEHLQLADSSKVDNAVFINECRKIL